MQPDYSQYSAAELVEALGTIDQQAFPDRTARLREEIATRDSLTPDTVTPAPVPADTAYSTDTHEISGNWILRYWRGQISLPVSYWLVGLGVTLLFKILGYLLEVNVERANSRSELGLYLLSIYPLLLIVLTWQSVGLFRSALNHPARGGTVGWSVAAIFMLCVGLVVFSVDAVRNGIPIIKEGVELVFDDNTAPATSLRVLNQGTEIELYGGIEVGSEVMLEAALKAHPEVNLIHLHSVGGRLLGALRLADVIRRYGLTTYVKETCYSSCTVVYLAGKTKLLGSDANLYFHSASIGGASMHNNADLGQALFDAYADAGVADWFIYKVQKVPNQEFLNPSHSELMKAGVVDRIVDPDQFGFSVMDSADSITTESVEAGLLTQDFMVAMKAQDSMTFADMLAVNLDGMREGLPLQKLKRETARLLDNRLPFYFAHASNEALVSYWQVVIDKMDALSNHSPLGCAAIAFPEAVPETHHSPEVSYNLRARELAALARVINSLKQDRAGYTAAQQQALISALLDKIQQQQPVFLDVYTEPEAYLGQADLLCQASIAMQRGFLDFDTAVAGQLLRSIYTQ
ncbi:hypothetical protein [Alteromonas gilva]|uniref:Uncharacterized protein n=1 Tax=Alteromonas gilva TaxID=2987522 RepID=A0ABT5KY19_9ALTE|nr:hypothetical protein [Alteromonas gilva]MDC8829662.1 hypothetical protein [Alteromonas gilva]